jgi:hypothetical protein
VEDAVEDAAEDVVQDAAAAGADLLAKAIQGICGDALYQLLSLIPVIPI